MLKYIPCKTIGITGTKGKSTTSSVIHKVLIDQGKKALLLGNIGEPYFNDLDLMTTDTILVLELSSHALEFVKHSPNIAILLDVFQEHLDHYNSFEEYVGAKFNIHKFQTNKDYFIYNAINDYMKAYMKKHKVEVKSNDIGIMKEADKNILVKNKNKNYIYIEGDNIYYNKEILCNKNINTPLKGEHNLNNILFVLGISKILDLDINKMLESFKNFKPLEHRLEFVAEKNGITFYNDSIATIPEATMGAIKALKNVNTVIVGGTDRKVDLTELCEFLKENDEVENILCLPETGEYIFKKLENSGKTLCRVKDVKEAVQKGNQITKKGKICLLSPAAASYGFYKNFEERGKAFKTAIDEL